MGFGQLPYDVAHVLGGAMLLVSFVLLYQRRIAALVNALALQGCLLAAAAVWQGYVQGAPQLYVTGLIALAAKGIAIPVFLHRMMRSRMPDRAVEPVGSIGLCMLGGVLLVALAILVVLPATTGARALAREDLAIALSIVLLGLLTMITRRSALGQVAGLMTLENGLVLGAVGVAGMPLVIELSTAGLVLVIIVIAGFFARLLRERFDSLDTDMLHPHRGEGQ
ncbi:hydrogenase-4 component E [Roseococcus sp. SYP-B2431]|uniref:hydrogenase-4 component E n=1 Tax=Roseococcus sp. SYP-B2431 TaxID=2496640 RepID=UPI00103DAF28|nr:hydrogenase-4 component E [Roseococcus sp. SYP-B2431]TCH98001.1 hydrogenase-4 component E [Roseococcus sp. SYP-B2431]